MCRLRQARDDTPRQMPMSCPVRPSDVPYLAGSGKGVEHRNARELKIADVMRGNRKAVCQGGRGNHAVQHGKRLFLFP